MNASCCECSKPCLIECGKCYSVLEYLGQKHNCPDNDEGFFDENDGSSSICPECEECEGTVYEFPERTMDQF